MELESAISAVLGNQQGVNQLALMKMLDSEAPQLSAIELLKSSSKSEVRQFCGVLLRRKCQSDTLSDAAQQSLKNSILDQIVTENDMSVVRSLCDLASAIAADLLGELDEECSERELDKCWPQLAACVSKLLSTDSLIEKGIRLLAVSTEEAPELFVKHITPLCKTISSLMTSQASSHEMVQLLIKAMGNLAPICPPDAVGEYRLLVPKCLAAIQKLVSEHPDEASACLEVFEAFAQSEASILALHPLPVTEFLLSIAKDKNLDDGLRIHAIHTLTAVVSYKRKLFTKQNVMDVLLKSLWDLVESDLHAADNRESVKEFCMWQLGKCVPEKMLTAVVQAIQAVAGSLPPTKLVTAVFELSRASGGGGPTATALIVLGAIIEDCTEFITKNCLSAAIQAMMVGIGSPNPLIRLAAFFALTEACQFLPMSVLVKEHITPILQAVVTCLGGISVTGPVVEETELVDVVVLNCLDELFENLPSENIAASFDALLTKIVEIATQSPSFLTRQVAYTVLHRICEKYGTLTAPKATQLADFLSSQITNGVALTPQMTNVTPLQQEEIRLDAIHTLTALVEGLGKKMHKQLIAERPALFDQCLQVCAMFLQQPGGIPPEYKSKVYFLIAELSPFVAHRLIPELPVLVKFLTESAKTSPMKESDQHAAAANGNGNGHAHGHGHGHGHENCNGHHNGHEKMAVAGGSDPNEIDDDDMDLNNDIVDEVASAVTCLGNIATSVGTAFMPYYNDVFETVWLLSAFPSSTIRDSVISASCDLLTFASNHTQAVLDHHGAAAPEILARRINDVMTVWMEQAYQVLDMDAVAQVLAGIEEILRRARPLFAPYKQFVPLLLGLVHDTFNKKLRCQQIDDDDMPTGNGRHEGEEDEDDEDEESERRRILLEQACEVASGTLRTFGLIDEAQNLLNKILDWLAKQAISKKATTGDKSMAYGGMADIIDALQAGAGNYANKLYNSLLKGLQDEDDEVRQNAVYAMGTLCYYGSMSLASRLDDVFVACERMLASEHEVSVRDNILATMCRVLVRGPPGSLKSPRVAQFAAKLATEMPFRGDPRENRAAFIFFSWLMSNSAAAATPVHSANWAAPLVNAVGQIVEENLLEIEDDCGCHHPGEVEGQDIYADECRQLLGSILDELKKAFPADQKLAHIIETYSKTCGAGKMAM